MKVLLVFFLFFTVTITCFSQIADNTELQDIYNSDQSDRVADNIDREVVSKSDSLRKVRVYELLAIEQVKTANDFENAAMIFQHGNDFIDYAMAVKLMRKAIDLDSARSKWLHAAAIDRELMSKNKPQIYGTQYINRGKDTPYELYQIDSTIVTDAERKQYGVETLKEQKEKVFYLNKKSLFSVFENGWSNHEILKILELEKSKMPNPDYDVREMEVRTIAHDLMTSNKLEQALILVKYSTELYPFSAGAYEMYARYLLKQNRKKESLIAYKKTLQLNPADKEIEKIIREIERE